MTDSIEARWEAHNEAGRRYFSQGDFANAEQAFVAAIREATAIGGDNVRLASSLSNLGQLKYKQKDLAQAEALFRRSLAIRETVLGPEHFGLVQNLNNLAALHYARGELEQAEPLFRRALLISEQALGEAHPDVAVTLNNLARLYFRRNDFKAAAPLLLRLLTIKQEALGASHPEVAAILTSLAKVRYAEGEYDAGEQLARRALAIREKIHVPNDPSIATALETLAEICGARGKRDEEMDLRRRAVEIREASMGADHPAAAASRATLELRRVSVETVQLGEISGEYHKVDTAMPTPDQPRLRIDSPSAGIERRVTPPAAPPVTPLAPPAIAPAAAAPPPPAAVVPPAASVPMAAAPPAAPPAPRVAPPGPPAAPAAPMAAAPPAQVAAPLSTTTKSKSLPWIEAPTSPVVMNRPGFTPPPRVEGPTGPVNPNERVARIPAVSDGVASRTPSETYASLLTQSTSLTTVPSARIEHHEEYTSERREVSLEDWPLHSRRPWLKYAAAATIVAAGAGAWFLYGRGAFAARAAALPAPVTAAKAPETSLAAKAVGPIVKDSAAVQSAPEQKVDPAPPPPAPPPERPAKAAAAQDNEQVTPPSRRSVGAALPTVNVDKIMKAIDDSARAQRDSAGKSLNVSAPVFKGRPPNPPPPQAPR